MKRIGTLVGVVVAGLGASMAASSQTAKMSTTGDESFVQKAAIAGMTEIEASKVALQKSSDANVKKFAQHMIDDHTKAGEALKSAATQEGLSVPRDMDAEHEKLVDRLNGLSGAQFDAAYKSQMLEDHQKAVALFQTQAKEMQSPVDKFAADTLPTLQSHLKMAQELNGK
jgi:putative membrane protein